MLRMAMRMEEIFQLKVTGHGDAQLRRWAQAGFTCRRNSAVHFGIDFITSYKASGNVANAGESDTIDTQDIGRAKLADLDCLQANLPGIICCRAHFVSFHISQSLSGDVSNHRLMESITIRSMNNGYMIALTRSMDNGCMIAL
jgi:hypothetical protein